MPLIKEKENGMDQLFMQPIIEQYNTRIIFGSTDDQVKFHFSFFLIFVPSNQP